MNKKILTILTLASLMSSVFASEEDFFKEATKYTVKIRTSVKNPLESDSKGTTNGAGFIINKEEGLIATNAHVVSRSPSIIEIALKGQDFIRAKKIYVDDFLDFTIIKVDNIEYLKNAQQARINCDDEPVQVGHPVGAFGHPNNYFFTGTKGIISNTATNRLETEMLQTDAPINPGNSGGPLISLRGGVVIGMNTATLSNSQNNNFAIKAEYFCKIIDLLAKRKDPSPPKQDIVFFKDIEQNGILKVAINNSELNDLREGDVILEVNGKKVSNETELFHWVRGSLKNVPLLIKRNNKQQNIVVNFEPQEPVMRRTGLIISGATFSPIIYIRNYTELGLKKNTGLVITDIEEGSASEMKLLPNKSIVYKINGKPINNIDELEKIANKAKIENKDLHIIVKQFGGNKNLFNYIEYNIPVVKIDKIENIL